jgi:hypothetical protein
MLYSVIIIGFRLGFILSLLLIRFVLRQNAIHLWNVLYRNNLSKQILWPFLARDLSSGDLLVILYNINATTTRSILHMAGLDFTAFRLSCYLTWAYIIINVNYKTKYINP